MDFLTFEFWFLFLLFVPLYYFLDTKGQNRFLALGNLGFLALLGKNTLGIFSLCFFSSYFVYRQLSNSSRSKEFKKRLLFTYITLQIVLLFSCKLLKGVSPLGLSYYTFGMIAFLLEVYWKRTRVEATILDYFISIAFFPVFLMGPIQRLSHFKPQIEVRRIFNPDTLLHGSFFIFLGLFKLVAISTPLDRIISPSHEMGIHSYGFGLLGYCFLAFMKLYAEFSGFIDVVTGISLCLGLKVIKNFDQPYFAKNVNDVWKRWHISLTSWLRDFIFMPLLLQTKSIHFSAIVVLLLVGVWHGTKASILYWGPYWVLAYLVYMTYLHFSSQKKLALPAFFNIALTLLITSLSTIAFMLPHHPAQNILSNLFSLKAGGFSSLLAIAEEGKLNLLMIIFALGLMIALESFDKKNPQKLLKIRLILLTFAIALMGEFKLTSLLYLNL